MSTLPLRPAGWGAAAALLLLPLFAMQFTRDVRWGPLDFAVFAAMLGAAGGGLELAVRASGNAAYRAGACVALATGFLLVWINLAVGFIGSEDNIANLVFAGVLTVAIVGSAVAQGASRGMARAMAATAAAQALASLLALGEGPAVLAVCAGFTGLWAFAAWLFGRAAAADR